MAQRQRRTVRRRHTDLSPKALDCLVERRKDEELEYEVRDIVKRAGRARSFDEEVAIVDAVMRRKKEILDGKQTPGDVIAEETRRVLRASPQNL